MEELTSLQAELPELESQRNLAKRQLEEETLVRVDLENRLQSMKEELVFKKSLFDSELNETRKKKELEITEIGALVDLKGIMVQALVICRRHGGIQLTSFPFPIVTLVLPLSLADSITD